MSVSDGEGFKSPAQVEEKLDNDTVSSHTADNEHHDMYESTAALAYPSVDERPPTKRIFVLEPAVALAYFAMNLSGTVFQNQLLYQTCTAIFSFSAEECTPYLNISRNNNGSSREIDNLVQPYVSTLLMVNSLILSIIPAILILFIGPWSDKYGRRQVLLNSFISYLYYYGNMCLLTLYSRKSNVSPWLYIGSALAPTFSGGTCAMITVVCCSISDKCVGQSVAIRMYSNAIAMGLGIIVGNLSSSYLLEATNMATVFGVSTFAMFLSILYIYFFAPESLTPQEASIWIKIRDFFSLNLVKMLFLTCCKQRRECGRAFLWMTMTAVVLASFASTGESNVMYLFVRRKFHWILVDFSTFNAVTSGIQIIGGILGIVVLRKMLKVSIVTLALIALGCCVMQSTVRAASAYAWEMYLASGLGFFAGMLTAMLYTVLTFLGTVTEMGKIFALTNSLAILAPLVSAPVYTSVYNSSFLIYSGMFNIISALLYLLCFGLMATIFGIRIARSYQFY